MRCAILAECAQFNWRSSSIAAIANCPIEANFIGKKITTKDNEVVEVKLKEIDGEDAIYVMEKT